MRKKIILLMTIVMSIFMLVGCTDKVEKYREDEISIQRIVDLDTLLNDSYNRVKNIDTSENIKNFSDYCDKIIKEAKKVDVVTSEGKDLKKARIKRLEYSKKYLINNWNDKSKQLIEDSKYRSLTDEIRKISNKFSNNKQEAIYDKNEKSSRFEVVHFILSLIIGTVVFFLLNQVMNITYFGFGAIGSFWFGCVLFSGLGIMLLGEILFELLKWIIIIVIILAIIALVVNKVNSNHEQ
ncbi:hypothetical protein [Romboutsia timonensis]|uniref:hypothetical protein n=1 Tax=Romboutsia timonensis TaxID=1776391 RepID=UPI0039946218